MKWYCLFLFFFIVHHDSAQGPRMVLDRETKAPIPFATVKVLHSVKGEMASAKGAFTMDLTPTDSLLVSCVGYMTRKISAGEIGEVIFLERKPEQLQGVVIRETLPLRTIVLGNGKELINKNFKCRMDGKGAAPNCMPWGPSNMKEEFAEKIPLPDSSHVYRLLKAYVPTREDGDYGPLLLRIYEIDTVTDMPGEEIFMKVVEVHRKDVHQGKVLIDLSADEIYISEAGAIVLSLGWPPGVRGGTEDHTTLALFKTELQNSYTRLLTSSSYHWTHPTRVQAPTKITTAFALEVEERVYK